MDVDANWNLILRQIATILACCYLRKALAQLDFPLSTEKTVSLALQKGECYILESEDTLKAMLKLQINWEDLANELRSKCSL